MLFLIEQKKLIILGNDKQSTKRNAKIHLLKRKEQNIQCNFILLDIKYFVTITFSRRAVLMFVITAKSRCYRVVFTQGHRTIIRTVKFKLASSCASRSKCRRIIPRNVVATLQTSTKYQISRLLRICKQLLVCVINS